MDLPEKNKTQELLYIAKWLKNKGLDVVVAKSKADIVDGVIFSDRDCLEVLYYWSLENLSGQDEPLIAPAIFWCESDGRLHSGVSFLLSFDKNRLELLYREFLYLAFKYFFTDKEFRWYGEKEFASYRIDVSQQASFLSTWAAECGFTLSRVE